MTKRKRSVLLSVLTLLLCLAVVAAGSYALFTDEVRFEEHLQAGTLDISLIRTHLVKTTLDKDGYLDSIEIPDDIDYTKTNPENAFGLIAGEKVVPGSKFVATFEIQNNSDVAFGYTIDIVCKNKSEGENLAKQLKVTVNSDDNSEGLSVTGKNGYIEAVTIGDTATFTVTVEFVDSHATTGVEANNLAKNQKIYFDLVVNAIQLTEAP